MLIRACISWDSATILLMFPVGPVTDPLLQVVHFPRAFPHNFTNADDKPQAIYMYTQSLESYFLQRIIICTMTVFKGKVFNYHYSNQSLLHIPLRIAFSLCFWE